MEDKGSRKKRPFFNDRAIFPTVKVPTVIKVEGGGEVKAVMALPYE